MSLKIFLKGRSQTRNKREPIWKQKLKARIKSQKGEKWSCRTVTSKSSCAVWKTCQHTFHARKSRANRSNSSFSLPHARTAQIRSLIKRNWMVHTPSIEWSKSIPLLGAIRRLRRHHANLDGWPRLREGKYLNSFSTKTLNLSRIPAHQRRRKMGVAWGEVDHRRHCTRDSNRH